MLARALRKCPRITLSWLAMCKGSITILNSPCNLAHSHGCWLGVPVLGGHYSKHNSCLQMVHLSVLSCRSGRRRWPLVGTGGWAVGRYKLLPQSPASPRRGRVEVTIHFSLKAESLSLLTQVCELPESFRQQHDLLSKQCCMECFFTCVSELFSLPEEVCQLA